MEKLTTDILVIGAAPTTYPIVKAAQNALK